jgi:hypothetical protein
MAGKHKRNISAKQRTFKDHESEKIRQAKEKRSKRES